MELKKILSLILALQFLIISLAIITPNTAQAAQTNDYYEDWEADSTGWTLSKMTRANVGYGTSSYSLYTYNGAGGSSSASAEITTPSTGTNYSFSFAIKSATASSYSVTFGLYTAASTNTGIYFELLPGLGYHIKNTASDHYAFSTNTWTIIRFEISAAHDTFTVWKNNIQVGSTFTTTATTDLTKCIAVTSDCGAWQTYFDNIRISHTSAAANATWQPTITSTPETTATIGTEYSYSITTNETSTFTAPTKPAWATLTGNTIRGTPTNTTAAAFEIIANSTAGTLHTHQYWNVTASPVTWQPTITSTPIETATLGEPYHYHVTTNESATIELEISPSWLSWNNSTKTLEGTPDNVTEESVRFAATSINGTLAAHQVFTINVTNPAPIISGTPTDYARVREYYTWKPAADMTVTWSMTPTNGLEIDTVSGEIYGIPDSPGTYTITITATSTEYYTTDALSYSLTVNPGAVVVEEPETPTPTPAASGTTIIFGLDMTTLIIIGFIIMAILLIATRRRH